jgi:hypothetical protein
LPYPDRFRHAQVGKGVEDRRPDVGFGDLPLEGPGVQGVAQLLQSVHPVFREAAPVVAALVLPDALSLGVDLLEDRIAGMIVSPGNGAFPRGNGGTRAPLGDGGVAAVAVVGTLGRYLGDLAFDLVEQAGQDFAVAPVGGGHFNADDVLGAFVYGQVDLAPRAPLADPVLAYLPFPFAENLQPGRIDHPMRRPLARPARNRHRKFRRPSRQVAVVRDRQVQVAQAHQATSPILPWPGKATGTTP